MGEGRQHQAVLARGRAARRVTEVTASPEPRHRRKARHDGLSDEGDGGDGVLGHTPREERREPRPWSRKRATRAAPRRRPSETPSPPSLRGERRGEKVSGKPVGRGFAVSPLRSDEVRDGSARRHPDPVTFVTASFLGRSSPHPIPYWVTARRASLATLGYRSLPSQVVPRASFHLVFFGSHRPDTGCSISSCALSHRVLLVQRREL